MASKLSILSSAFVLLGGRPVSSIDDNTAEAVIASSLYDNSLETLLVSHRWRFATKKAVLSKLSKVPLNGFASAFQIPAESLYIIGTTTDNYEIYGTEIHSNSTELSAEYIYRVEESKFPAYFTRTLEFYLASQFSVPLTGDLNKADYYAKVYLDQIRKAKFADSTQRPPDEVKDNPYIEVRA